MPAPLTVATPNDTDVVIVRTFDAPRALVWRAHTEPELVQKWMLGPPGWSMTICEVDLRVGGKFRIGWTHPDHPAFEVRGTYREITPPERIVHTEEYTAAGAPQASDRDDRTVETTVFTEKAGKTTLTMTMHYPSKKARDAAVKTGMTDGMEHSYRKLDQTLAAAPAV